MDKITWQDRVVETTHGNLSRLGCILMTAMHRVPDEPPRFIGRASITSDGFIMCDFENKSDERHMGAFVGSVADLERNVIGLCDHLLLADDERQALFTAVRAWVASDYRSRPGLFPEASR